MFARPTRALGWVRRPQPVSGNSGINDVLVSPGQDLDPTTRHAMQSALGHDFSRVKVHVGAAAAHSAAAVGATAFTVGNHIVFGSGQYAPTTEEGRALLRHELTHTVQQADVDVASSLQHTQPGDRFEAEAEHAGRGVASGWAPSLRAASPMLARRPVPDARRRDASHRSISITIGGSPEGQTVTFSYPVDDGRYYVVPLYTVTVAGTDVDGKPVTTKFKALRFGIYYDPKGPVGANKSTGPFVAGRADGQKHTAGFRDDYEVHSADSNEPMAWDLNGGFLIHDGPDAPIDPAKFDPAKLGDPADAASPSNNLYATIGCVEITGDHGFTKFNDLIISLSGSKLGSVAALNEIARLGLVKVTYEKASRPRLTLWQPPKPAGSPTRRP